MLLAQHLCYAYEQTAMHSRLPAAMHPLSSVITLAGHDLAACWALTHANAGVQEPLLLQSVHFEGLHLASSKSSHAHTVRSIQDAHAKYAVRAAMLKSTLESLKAVPIRAGKEKQPRTEKHIPLQLRAKEPLLADRARRERGLQQLLDARHSDLQSDAAVSMQGGS